MGAITVLLPVYMHFLDVPQVVIIPQVTFVYTLAIGFLMVSRLPVYSGKRLGTRVPPDLVLIVFIGVVLFFALLISYPWEVLTIGTIVYLASLPFGVLSYREHLRRDAQAAVAAQSGNVATPERPPSMVQFAANPDAANPDATKPDDRDRPTRH
jgi:CDP-diacylglycerol--serine O-phosphatidyltransferase